MKTASEWQKLTVVKLKEELNKRGLSVTGKKADLVKRLTEDDADSCPPEDEPPTLTASSPEKEASPEPEPVSPPKKATPEKKSPRKRKRGSSGRAEVEDEETPPEEPVAKKQALEEAEPPKAEEPDTEVVPTDEKPAEYDESWEVITDKELTEAKESAAAEVEKEVPAEEPSTVMEVEEATEVKETDEKAKEGVEDMTEEPVVALAKDAAEEPEKDEKQEAELVAALQPEEETPKVEEVKTAADEEVIKPVEEEKQNGVPPETKAVVSDEAPALEKEEAKTEKKEEEPTKKAAPVVITTTDKVAVPAVEVVTESCDDVMKAMGFAGFGAIRDESGDDKSSRTSASQHSRSRSRSPRRRSPTPKRKSPSPQIPVEMESDEWLQATNTQLDRYNSDLNLEIGADGLSCTPLSKGSFGYMWAGARAQFGVGDGKFAFQVKVGKLSEIGHLPGSETNKFGLRVGFSMESLSLQLGEDPNSFGYSMNGKSVKDSAFSDYGQSYTEGDVITAYLEFTGEDETVLSFAKNADHLGECFKVPQKLNLFPHVLMKNIALELNFGQLEEPWFPLQEGFAFMDSVSADKRIKASAPPPEKKDCEVLMMVGLPACGKTTWATQRCIEQSEKRYNMIGLFSILNKMTVGGKPIKEHFSGPWAAFLDEAYKTITPLLEKAAARKRNYIIDQGPI